MASELVPLSVLTPAQYSDLADVPPELEWLANITNLKTRRAYKRDVEEFSAFTGLRAPSALRTVTRAHVIAGASIVRKYGRETGINAAVVGLCVHSLRATALSNEANIAKVQDWLGHANVSTTRLYDRRDSKPEDSPTFHVKY